MMKDPDLRPLIDHPRMIGWIGPGRHIMTYPVVCLRLTLPAHPVHIPVFLLLES